MERGGEKKRTGKGYLFGDMQSCSTLAKITIACFCNCLDPSSDRPISPGPPGPLVLQASYSTVRGGSPPHAAPALRGNSASQQLHY